MLFSLKDLQNCQLMFQDGGNAKITNCLIDDYNWVVRYLVVRVDDRDSLLSPRTITEINLPQKTVLVDVSREMVLNSPRIDSSKKLSREIERQLYDYYDWPYDWERDEVPNTLPGDLTSIPLIEMELEREEEERELQQELIPETGAGASDLQIGPETHIRSASEIFGYTIFAAHDEKNAGKLNDLIIQAEDWNIQYMVLETGGLRNGPQVLLAPTWVNHFDESHSRISVDLKEESIRNSPTFASMDEFTPDYEAKVKDYYRRD